MIPEWLVLLLVALSPAFLVLAVTGLFLIDAAVQRHRARQDGDYVTEYKHRQP